jgi:cysteine desulfurase
MASKPPKPIYLDHAAATPMSKSVRSIMELYFSDLFYNPSATYSGGLEAKDALNGARATVAAILEANNMAIHGVMRAHPDSNLVISAIEHDSVLKPSFGYDYKLCPVKSDGLVDLESLEKLIDDQTVLVSLMYVNNEIGTIEPINEIARLVNTIRLTRRSRGLSLPLYIHTDACQAANYLDLHVSRLGIDLMTLNGGKIYGPKQSGVLYVRSGTKLLPLIEGGGQEHGLRSGTENVAGAIGLAKALEEVQTIRKDETRRLELLRSSFIQKLLEIRPDILINGSIKQRIANNLHLTIPGIDNEWLLIKLDEAGILAAAGSACSASNQDPSHVLGAIGLSDEQARSSIRISLGQSTNAQQLDKTIEIIKKLIKS